MKFPILQATMIMSQSCDSAVPVVGNLQKDTFERVRGLHPQGYSSFTAEWGGMVPGELRLM